MTLQQKPTDLYVVVIVAVIVILLLLLFGFALDGPVDHFIAAHSQSP